MRLPTPDSERKLAVVDLITRAIMPRELFGRLFDDLSLGVLVLPDRVPDEDPHMLVLDVRHRVATDAYVPGRDHEYQSADDRRRLVAPSADPSATLENLLDPDARTVRSFTLAGHSAARGPKPQSENVTRKMCAVVLVVVMKPASADPRDVHSDKSVELGRAWRSHKLDRLRPAARRRDLELVEALKDTGRAHSAADAHRNHSVAFAGAFQFLKDRCRQFRAGTA